MKKFCISILALAVVLVAAATAGAATGKKPIVVAFTGTYAGKASTQVERHHRHHLGQGHRQGHAHRRRLDHGPTAPATRASSPASPSAAPARSRAPRERSPSSSLPGASGCGDEGGHTFTITAHLTVMSATGKLAKAKGTLKITGAYSHDDGSF